jgi:hypothetical protein
MNSRHAFFHHVIGLIVSILSTLRKTKKTGWRNTFDTPAVCHFF